MRTVLLDSQIALWMLLDSPHLPKHIRHAAQMRQCIWIFHQVSLWEIQIKYSLGKLVLPRRPEDFLPDAISEAGFEERFVQNAAIYFLDRMPTVHNDPFDRLLMAHGIINGWEMATVDGEWDKYPVRIFRG